MDREATFSGNRSAAAFGRAHRRCRGSDARQRQFPARTGSARRSIIADQLPKPTARGSRSVEVICFQSEARARISRVPSGFFWSDQVDQELMSSEKTFQHGTEIARHSPAVLDQAKAREHSAVRVPAGLRSLIRQAALILALLAGAAAGGYYVYQYWTIGRYLESTDDAYVKADYTTIAPKVAGYIAEVLVQDNQRVTAGQV